MNLRLLLHKDILLVFVSKVANGISTLGLNLYAIHFLAPSDFGVLTLCTTMLMLLDGLIGAALDLAVVKLHPLEHLTDSGSPIEQAAIGLKTSGCLFFGLLLTACAPIAGRLLLHRDDVRLLFFTWACAATAVLTLRSTQLALQIRGRTRSFAAIELVNTALRIGLVVWMVHHGHRSSLAIIASFAIGSFVALVTGLTTLVVTTKVVVWWKLQQAGLVLRTASNALLTYGTSAIASRMDVLVLAIAAPTADLGLYGAAMTLASLPEIAATYLAPALLPRIVPFCRQGLFVNFFTLFHRILYITSCLSYLAALWLMPRYGHLILGPKYTPALALTLVLLPGTLATMSIFPVSLNLLMLRGSKVFLFYDLTTAPVLIVVYALAAHRSILGVAIITSSTRLVKTLIIQTMAGVAAREAQREWTVANSITNPRSSSASVEIGV